MTVACAILLQIIKPMKGLERRQKPRAERGAKMYRKTEGLENWLRIDAKFI
jgi:hypothetical protein